MDLDCLPVEIKGLLANNLGTLGQILLGILFTRSTEIT